MSATGVLDDPDAGDVRVPDRAGVTADRDLGPAGPDVPSASPRLRLAFVAHAGRRIALRATGAAAAVKTGLPHDLGPGERLGGLAFAELATAFRGVVEIDQATGEAVIVDRAQEGAPRRLRFRVDKRGAREGAPAAL
ncbi:MAG TPA: hypothetical protein VF606_06710, partial [Geminicoccaceae bacterium]